MIDIKLILDFLNDLENNNNREWYHAHKSERNLAMLEFEKLLQFLIDELSLTDTTIIGLRPKDLIFRLNRDTRFSKNLPPYKTAFSAHISSAGRFPIPAGYFICIQPNNSFIGGGVFATQFPQAITLVREHLINNSVKFLNIIQPKEFYGNFEVLGVKLKNVPRGYDKEHILAEYLKHKSWDIEYHFSDKELESSDIVCRTMVNKFKMMKVFNDFLNEALVEFKMPERKAQKK
ncbi:MAG: DUF2461 domain-containing protein [Clostridioides sp.]|jgi:uncharacterized protein (TIGR02453 family)|nr:DUF2461 domain-containing protein [Clostridioides sp.]